MPGRALLTIGSDPARCELVWARNTVSGVHAWLRRASDGTLTIEDAASTNGTFVDGVRVAGLHPVLPGQTIGLGKAARFELDDVVLGCFDAADDALPHVLDRPGTAQVGPAAKGPTFTQQLSASQLVAYGAERAGDGGPETAELPPAEAPFLCFGYEPSNDVVVSAPGVSSRHARLYLHDDRLIVQDLGSTNGTWIRGHRVQLAELPTGEAFALGSHVVAVDADLLARFDAQERPQVPFEPGRVIRVGRHADADVFIEASTVSAAHCTLTVLPSGAAYEVVDDGARNGTFLNARTHRIRRAVALPGDILFLGSYRLPVARLPDLVRKSRPTGPMPAQTAAGRRFVVGRDPTSADTAIPSSVVSARHAEITARPDGTYQIRDLGSSNGTFVDGERVRGTVVVPASARVSLGSCAVALDPSQGVVRRRFDGDVMLQAERVTVRVRDAGAPDGRAIVDDVSFTAFPTEFVGLMGPSGAGKTTLMLALNGYLPPTRGRSLVNGIDLNRSDGAFRGVIGYVPQDDIVFPQLTVYESLYYTARLRLPPDTSREEIDRRIGRVLEQLEIPHTRDVRIGDALAKGISGGERKRVNLAQELITEPSLLMLDEPTSGLAAEDTINVMRLLRGLADEGRTILLTIHQPSLEAYRLMDNVLLMMKGRLVYYGPAYPDSIQFFHPEADAAEREQLLLDPGNALKPVALAQRAAMATDPDGSAGEIERVAAEHAARFATSQPHREFVADRAVREGAAPVRVAERPASRTERSGAFRQWRVLTARTARIKWKDRVSTLILLAQAPIIATVLALVFAVPGGDAAEFERLQRAPAALFLLVASAVWFGCSNAAREIVGERAVYRRERMVNLTIPAYALSKVTVLAALCAVQCAMLLVITWGPLGFTGAPLAMYGALLATSLAGLGMGLTLSALAASVDAATALVPLLLIPQIILGGVIMPVHDMTQATRALASLTAARWGYEAMLEIEFGEDDVGAVAAVCEIPDCHWGVGATGVRYTYYPADPSNVAASERRGGVTALADGLVPAVAPVDQPVCHALCPSLQTGDELTPIERVFGVDPGDPWRARSHADIVVEGNAAGRWTAPSPPARTSLAAALGVLIGMLGFFTALVVALLRARDVESG